jgi:hypothetical protein
VCDPVGCNELDTQLRTTWGRRDGMVYLIVNLTRLRAAKGVRKAHL